MSAEDWWEIAAERLLGRLVDDGGIEMVTAHGVGALRGPLALHLLQLETGVEDQRPARRAERAALVAEWLVQQAEVADLFADDAALEAALAASWDPPAREAREAEQRVTRHAREPEIERRIIDNPDDDELLLLYGDWLQEQGDPLGEWVALQSAERADPSGRATRASRRLLRAHGDDWLGVLGDHPRIVRLDWHLGFIRRARLWRPPRCDPYEGTILLSRLLELRTARFLRELWIGPFCQGTARRETYGEMLAVLCAEPRPALRTLVVGEADFPVRDDYSEAGDLAPLSRALPALEQLRLSAGSATLGALELPRLQTLCLDLYTLRPGQPSILGHWQLPRVSRMQLGISSAPLSYREEAGPVLRQLLDQATTPALRQLALRPFGAADELIGLLEPGLLARLETLELRGLFTPFERDALALVRHLTAHATHLQRLRLTEHQLSPDAVVTLRQALPERALELQRREEGDGDPQATRGEPDRDDEQPAEDDVYDSAME